MQIFVFYKEFFEITKNSFKVHILTTSYNKVRPFYPMGSGYNQCIDQSVLSINFYS